MYKFNLPKYDFKLKEEGGKPQIFDVVRKAYVSLTPEEWVRQHFMHYLQEKYHYPFSLMSVEHSLQFNGMNRRVDILCHDENGERFLMVECKAATVPITQTVFDQIARYNMVLKVPYLVVTNGLEHFCCQMDYEANTYAFISDFPPYK